MSVSLDIVDFNEVFRSLSNTPIIINDLSDSSDDEKKELKRRIYSKYDSDLLRNIPSCDCGAITGEYNRGIFCEQCNTVVTLSLENDLEPILWLRAPDGVNKLINPMIWSMLIKRFKPSGFNIIHWLCDTTFRPKVTVPPVVYDIEESGIQRGYNYFVDNFDSIIAYLFKKVKVKATKVNYLENLLNKNRHKIFSDYIPLPNRTLLVIEENPTGIYMNPALKGVIDAIQTIVSIDNSKKSLRMRENRTVKTLVGLSEFYETYYRTDLGGKDGLFRQHIYGSRSHFSFRCVATSITAPHEYDEVHIPWSVAVSVFRYHVMNKLLRRGYSIKWAIRLLAQHTRIYNPLLDEIFTELINESPRKGIDVTLCRNPTLARGSIQLVRVTKVKKDPTINTVSFSILIVKPMNCDFDGDELSLTLTLDDVLTSQLRNLDPHKSCFDTDKPFGISENLAIPKTVVATISNWIHSDDNTHMTPEQNSFMHSLME